MRRVASRGPTSDSKSTGWGRNRLLAILGAAALAVALLLGGLGYAIYLAVGDKTGGVHADQQVATGDTGSPRAAQGASHRKEIATEPMLSVPPSAALPAESTTQVAPTIRIPAGTGATGPGFVMTGFPHTPEGAIGQLVQIDTAVLQSMSLQTAHEVYTTWALPGGVDASDWWITASVRAFLSSSGMGEVIAPSASITLEPAAALIKGTDGPDWTVVCVLMKATATYRQHAQIAFAHCERMQWVGGRWMLAPGSPPAPAPATWPGTALALEAGWRTFSTDDTTDPEQEHR